MLIRQHDGATTTPATRRQIQTARRQGAPVAALVRRFGVSEDTVRKWSGRPLGDVLDRSSERRDLGTKFTPLMEECVAELRTRFGLTTDDLLEVLLRAFPDSPVSRTGVHRCVARLRRTGRLPERAKEKPVVGVFAPESAPGFLHMDVKHLTRLKGRRSYIYVAIDRATRFVWAEVLPDLKTATAAGFVERVLAEAPFAVRVIVTDNGPEWTDRCAGRVRPRATGRHAVDRVCAASGVEHRLTRIRRPQTNGMVERFNRRLSEGLSRTERIKENSGRNCFASHAERNAFVARLVFNYNRTRQTVLGRRAPLEVLQSHRNLTERNTKAGISWNGKRFRLSPERIHLAPERIHQPVIRSRRGGGCFRAIGFARLSGGRRCRR